MNNAQNGKQHYDLEERTFLFAKNVRSFVRKLPKTIANIEDGKQLINASGSVGANYIEANESFSKKDFIFRIKICRKEAKESKYWLRLVSINNNAELDCIEIFILFMRVTGWHGLFPSWEGLRGGFLGREISVIFHELPPYATPKSHTC